MAQVAFEERDRFHKNLQVLKLPKVGGNLGANCSVFSGEMNAGTEISQRIHL